MTRIDETPAKLTRAQKLEAIDNLFGVVIENERRRPGLARRAYRDLVAIEDGLRA